MNSESLLINPLTSLSNKVLLVWIYIIGHHSALQLTYQQSGPINNIY